MALSPCPASSPFTVALYRMVLPLCPASPPRTLALHRTALPATPASASRTVAQHSNSAVSSSPSEAASTPPLMAAEGLLLRCFSAASCTRAGELERASPASQRAAVWQ
jgi:hypothetical protein